jgi:hypothetical protein
MAALRSQNSSADAGTGRVQHHEDARRARVPGRVQVCVPALVVGRVSGRAQPAQQFPAEVLGTVMTKDVLGVRVDPPRLDQRVELGHPHVHQGGQR